LGLGLRVGQKFDNHFYSILTKRLSVKAILGFHGTSLGVKGSSGSAEARIFQAV